MPQEERRRRWREHREEFTAWVAEGVALHYAGNAAEAARAAKPPHASDDSRGLGYTRFRELAGRLPATDSVPDEGTFHRIAWALQVSPREACRRAGMACSIPEVENTTHDDDDKDLIEALEATTRALELAQQALARRRGQ